MSDFTVEAAVEYQSALVTILIPVYNRYGYLERSIGFFNRYFDKQIVQVQVLDGSSPDNAQKNEALCLREGIGYWYYDSNMIHFYQRMLNGISRVNTPLAAILADDDLYDPDGFQAAVNFLLQHPDYTVAYGTDIHFETKRQDSQADFTCWSGDRHLVSVEADCPLQRLFDFFKRYHALYYGVHRTDILRLAYQEVIENVDPEDYKFHEFLLASQEVIHGKIKQLDVFFLAREAGQSTSYARTTMAEQMFEPMFSSRYQRYRASLMKYMPQFIPHEKVSYSIDLAFGLYIGSWLKPHRLRNRLRGMQLNQYYSQPNSDQYLGMMLKEALQSEPAKKELLFFSGRLKQTLRHPGKLLSKLFNRDFNYHDKKYQIVIPYLQNYKAKSANT